jgi:hypothetical protein
VDDATADAPPSLTPETTDEATRAALEDHAHPGYLALDRSPGPASGDAINLRADGESPSFDAITAAVEGVDDYYAMSLCKNVRAGARPTAECKDFCDTFRPTSAIDQALFWSTWAGWSSYLPEAMRVQLGRGIAQSLGRAAPGVGTVNAIACVPIAIGYIASEVLDQERCAVGSQCVACGAAAASRTACRIWDVARVCAQTMGVQIPIFTPVGLLARSCTLGAMAQRETYRNICSGSCKASIKAAVPVAAAETVRDDAGRLSKRKLCCRCVRDHHEDGWFSDPVFQSDFYNSVTVDDRGPTLDCEEREGRYEYPAASKHNGYRVYHSFRKCEKYYINSETCPTDPAFDPYP